MKKVLYLICFLVYCIGLEAHQMKVASYNIRFANRNDSINGNGWGQRCPVIADLIRYHDFDIFGTQEGQFHQVEELKNKLREYDYIGVGRDDGMKRGEFTAIYYKTDRFELLDEGNFWLSSTPDYPSLGWDADQVRLCTWGKFKDKQTGFVFMFFNLHADHVGVKSRDESVSLVLQKIKKSGGKLPVILTGDFNADQNSRCYMTIVNSKVLSDAYECAGIRYAVTGTFNAFDPNRKTTTRIDHIFLTSHFSVDRYGTLTDTYRIPVKNMENAFQARNPSDHFPVVAIIEYK